MEEITDEMLLSETINMEIVVDLDNNSFGEEKTEEHSWKGSGEESKEVETVTIDKHFGKIFCKVKNEVVVDRGS